MAKAPPFKKKPGKGKASDKAKDGKKEKFVPFWMKKKGKK